MGSHANVPQHHRKGNFTWKDAFGICSQYKKKYIPNILIDSFKLCLMCILVEKAKNRFSIQTTQTRPLSSTSQPNRRGGSIECPSRRIVIVNRHSTPGGVINFTHYPSKRVGRFGSLLPCPEVHSAGAINGHPILMLDARASSLFCLYPLSHTHTRRLHMD